MNKKFFLSFIAMIALAGAIMMGSSGCTTTKETVFANPDGTLTTNVVNTVDPQVIADAAVILRSASRSAAVLAMNDSADAKKYVNLAVATLETFVTKNDYTPGALTAALAPVLKQVKDPRIALAVDTATDMYEVFWGRYVKNKIASNETALLFLNALHDGAKSALTINASTISPTQ
jgi:hypothetical protein